MCKMTTVLVYILIASIPLAVTNCDIFKKRYWAVFPFQDFCCWSTAITRLHLINQYSHFNLTQLKNWSHLEVFFWHGKCFSLLSAGWFSSITVPGNVAQQSQNLLQMFVWEMLDHPHTSCISHQQFLSVSHIEGALVVTLFHLWWRCQTCYHHVADTKVTYVLCIWDGQTCLTLSCQGSSVEKWPTTGTFILFCQFPLEKSVLWFVVL